CLEKDRERRYQTSGELARDLRHYLAGEPIEAKRDRAWYLLRKTLRRYRVHVAVATAFILLLVSSTGALWVMYRGQIRERRLAESNETRAKGEAQRAQAVLALLDEMLQRPGVRDPYGGEMSIAEHLTEFARSLGERVRGQPGVEADVRTT